MWFASLVAYILRILLLIDGKFTEDWVGIPDVRNLPSRWALLVGRLPAGRRTGRVYLRLLCSNAHQILFELFFFFHEAAFKHKYQKLWVRKLKSSQKGLVLLLMEKRGIIGIEREGLLVGRLGDSSCLALKTLNRSQARWPWWDIFLDEFQRGYFLFSIHAILTIFHLMGPRKSWLFSLLLEMNVFLQFGSGVRNPWGSLQKWTISAKNVNSPHRR